ncbi:MAG: metallophosphoesterase family protein [Verrucomicrobiota bacterium]|nr:metallophosphoesterase family protein [Verrucomicrobiota bacterium]
MKTIITSDAHLGGRHCRVERFVSFLDRLPPDAALILNGDIVDAWRFPFRDPCMMKALDRIRAEARLREVTWIPGNNDADFVIPDPGSIRFVSDVTLTRGIYVTHGHSFDKVMHNFLFNMPFRLMHKLEISLGAAPIDVATYVKARWGWLYRLLQRHVIRGMAAYARERGYAAIVCGHLHEADDRVIEGVRYLNTGAWTEPGEHYVIIENGEIRLRAVEGAEARAPNTQHATLNIQRSTEETPLHLDVGR